MKTTTTYNRSKIFRNAWYLKKANASMTFSACLKKAWRNEKMAVMTARIEGRNLAEEDARAKTTAYRPGLITIPADYYGVRGMYYGD